MNMIDRTLPDGAWRKLFAQAMTLMDSLPQPSPIWSLGGGTALMLRHRHRESRDIDLFTPDPGILELVSPNYSSYAREIVEDYQEELGWLSLVLPHGQIDLHEAKAITGKPVELATVLGRTILLETTAEVIAKKLRCYGDRLTGRDLFDIALVLDREPECIDILVDIVAAHRIEIIMQLDTRENALRSDFDAIRTLDYVVDFDSCVRRIRNYLIRSL